MCTGLEPGKPLVLVVHPERGAAFEVELLHTFNEAQIQWFKAGSALNSMAKESIR